MHKATIALILITLFVLLGPYLGVSLFGSPTSSVFENELNLKRKSFPNQINSIDSQDEMEQVNPEDEFSNEINSEENVEELSGL